MKRLGIFFCLLLMLFCAVACGETEPKTTDVYPWPTDLFFSDLPPAAEKVTISYPIAEDGSVYAVLIEQMEYTEFYAYVTTLKELGFTADPEQGLENAETPDPETLYASLELVRDDLRIAAQLSAPESLYRFGNNAVVIHFSQSAS